MSATSLLRGLQVLASVIDSGEARADVLAADLGLPTSTVYRYLRDLRALDFVADADDGFKAGPRLSTVDSAGPSSSDVRRIAQPTLERLAVESGETALVAVRRGTHALCLQQVESPHPMRMAFRVGQRLPLYAGAASRVLLAHAPADVLDAVMPRIEPLTGATPDATDLQQRLSALRTSGIATSRGEFVSGAVAIAVPVLSGNRCICSVALAAPESRATARWQREAKALLQEARRDLEALV